MCVFSHKSNFRGPWNKAQFYGCFCTNCTLQIECKIGHVIPIKGYKIGVRDKLFGMQSGG